MEAAWNNAQPQLSRIRAELNANSQNNSRILRVGKLDSELLDQELVQLLQEPIRRTLSVINKTLQSRFEPELALIIQLALYKLSVWNNGATYGARLQDLKYHTPYKSDGNTSPSGLPRRILLIHGALTILVPYVHTRIRAHALSNSWPDAPSSDRRRKFWNLLTAFESAHAALSLLNFGAFLWNGRYRAIADRMLNMTLIPSQRLARRDISYEFMNRQMVWHAFTEFLLFLLPILNARQVRRRLNRIMSCLSPFSYSRTGSEHTRGKPQHGKYWSLPLDQCAICAENAAYSLDISSPENVFTSFSSSTKTDIPPPEITEGSVEDPPPFPINTPYLTSCGHIYCYHCITERMLRAGDDTTEEQEWECLRCCQAVKEADRYTVDIGLGSESGSDFEFSGSSRLGSTEFTGSLGSYSESGFSDSSS